MLIRHFTDKDAQAVSDLVIQTMRVSNSRDYPLDILEELILHQRPEDILEKASWTHFYVAEEKGKIIGCGAIGPYFRKTDESSLFTFFVHPDFQRQGIGQRIMARLEQDNFYRRAKRVEIPASITGLPFYLKMGYSYKDGISSPDEEMLYHLEKRKQPEPL